MDGDRMNLTRHPVCGVDDVWPNTGVCALIEGRQIAVFRVVQADGEHWYALDNLDPQSGAQVLSRGLVGSLGSRIVVASPIYKHHYDLATGECLEDAQTPVAAWRVVVENGQVWVLA